ncbi:MAG: hypothetical protein H6732_02325 [Alphaproteobacteria bacterium]|nr:hypothetical protein [Alphaproteobacteria bacterium]
MGTLVLGPRAALLGPARAVAAGAALAVVLAELLPHAVESLGAGALLLAVGAGLLPLAADRALARAARDLPAGRSARELGFAALVAHQLVDGLQAGAARTLGLGVVFAIALHGAPLVAAAVLAWPDRRRAAVRGLGLVAATAAGVLLTLAVSDAALAGATPWVGALVSGFLAHVVLHDLARDRPEALARRGGEALALLGGAGATLAVLATGGHAAHGAGGVAIGLVGLLALFRFAAGGSEAPGGSADAP